MADLRFAHTSNKKGPLLFVAGPEADPHFAVVQYDAESHKLSGVIGTPAGRGVPICTPFMLWPGQGMEHGGMDPAAMEAFGSYVLLRGAQRHITLKEKAGIQRGADKLLGISPSKSTTEWSVPDALRKEMANRGMFSETYKTVHGLYGMKLGQPENGFMAHQVRRLLGSKIAGVLPMSPMDIEKAKACLGSVPRPSSFAVAWYAGSYALTQKAQENKAAFDAGHIPQPNNDRAEAAQGLPIFADYIAKDIELSRAVDRRDSFRKILSERTGLGKAALKRMAKITEGAEPEPLFAERAEAENAIGVARHGITNIQLRADFETAIKVLGALPPDRAPASNEDWLAFNAVLSGFAVPASEALGIAPEKLLEGCKGSWVDFKNALAKSADFEPEEFTLPRMAITTGEMIEAINLFVRSVAMPEILRELRGRDLDITPSVDLFTSMQNAAFAVAVDAMKANPANFLTMGRRFAGRAMAIMEHSISPPEAEFDGDQAQNPFRDIAPESYPTIVPTYDDGSGRVIVQINSRKMAKEDSSRLGHCVGTHSHYYETGRRFDTMLFSVRSPDMRVSFSTFELTPPDLSNPDRPFGAVSLKQHQRYGRINARTAQEAYIPPIETDIKMREAFMEKLKRGEIEVDVDTAIAWKNHVGKASGKHLVQRTWKDMLGFDPFDKDAAAGLGEEWRYVYGNVPVMTKAKQTLMSDERVISSLATKYPYVFGETANDMAPA